MLKLRTLLVVSTFLIAGCSEKRCSKWEYASFQLSSSSKVENDEVTELNIFVIWVSNDSTEKWYDSAPVTNTNDKGLAEYFEAKSIHPISIFNALGKEGWEVYDVEYRDPSVNVQIREWQLKRCLE